MSSFLPLGTQASGLLAVRKRHLGDRGAWGRPVDGRRPLGVWPSGPARLPAAGAQAQCPSGRFVFSGQAEALATSCG